MSTTAMAAVLTHSASGLSYDDETHNVVDVGPSAILTDIYGDHIAFFESASGLWLIRETGERVNTVDFSERLVVNAPTGHSNEEVSQGNVTQLIVNYLDDEAAGGVYGARASYYDAVDNGYFLDSPEARRTWTILVGTEVDQTLTEEEYVAGGPQGPTTGNWREVANARGNYVMQYDGEGFYIRYRPLHNNYKLVTDSGDAYWGSTVESVKMQAEVYNEKDYSRSSSCQL